MMGQGKKPTMYNPDQADIDPRNPANYEERQADRFLIDGVQFTDEQLNSLKSTDDIDTVFESEGLATHIAFQLARAFNMNVWVDCGTGVKGDYEWFDGIVVKPTVKVS